MQVESVTDSLSEIRMLPSEAAPSGVRQGPGQGQGGAGFGTVRRSEMLKPET